MVQKSRVKQNISSCSTSMSSSRTDHQVLHCQQIEQLLDALVAWPERSCTHRVGRIFTTSRGWDLAKGAQVRGQSSRIRWIDHQVGCFKLFGIVHAQTRILEREQIKRRSNWSRNKYKTKSGDCMLDPQNLQMPRQQVGTLLAQLAPPFDGNMLTKTVAREQEQAIRRAHDIDDRLQAVFSQEAELNVFTDNLCQLIRRSTIPFGRHFGIIYNAKLTNWKHATRN